MDQIEIRCIISQTLQPRTCGRLEVFQSLHAHNRFLSTQTLEFELILNHSVKARMTHLNAKIEQCRVETVELC